jgi:hypothetical protein
MIRFLTGSRGLALSIGAIAVGLLAPAGAFADILTTYGDISVVTPGPDGEPSAWQVMSDASGDVGGLELQITGTLTPDTLADLMANYQWLEGTFGGGGAPRFTLFDDSFNSAYVFWGANGYTDTDPNSGAWGSTGNLADPTNTNDDVESNGFGGDNNPNTFVTWAQFLAAEGTTPISYITVDLDGAASVGGPDQQMLLNDFTVNSETFDAPTSAMPEPSSFAGVAMLLALGFVMGKRKLSRT